MIEYNRYSDGKVYAELYKKLLDSKKNNKEDHDNFLKVDFFYNYYWKEFSNNDSFKDWGMKHNKNKIRYKSLIFILKKDFKDVIYLVIMH